MPSLNNMKKIIYILLFLFHSVFLSARSLRDMNHYLNICTGYMYKSTLPILIEYEMESRQIHAFAIYIDMTTTYKYCETDRTYFCTAAFWHYKSLNFGFAYKPRMVKWKNNCLRGRVGIDLGLRQFGMFNLSIDLGIEYCHAFKNRVQLYITQKNDFVFWSRYHFKNGLLVGVKIPMN